LALLKQTVWSTWVLLPTGLPLATVALAASLISQLIWLALASVLMRTTTALPLSLTDTLAVALPVHGAMAVTVYVYVPGSMVEGA
jgi:hypothetical protein